jgi:hypothetical protein
MARLHALIWRCLILRTLFITFALPIHPSTEHTALSTQICNVFAFLIPPLAPTFIALQTFVALQTFQLKFCRLVCIDFYLSRPLSPYTLENEIREN